MKISTNNNKKLVLNNILIECDILDVSNQTNLLLNNLKIIFDKLQSEKAFIKTQVEKLKIENNQLTILNKTLKNKVNVLGDELQRKNLL